MVSEGIGEIRLELQERLKRAGDDRISAKALARKFGKCIRGIFGDRGNGWGEGARGYVEPDDAESQYVIGEKHFVPGNMKMRQSGTSRQRHSDFLLRCTALSISTG